VLAPRMRAAICCFVVLRSLGNQFPKRNGGNFLPPPFFQGIILPQNLVTAVHSHMRRPNAGNWRDWKLTLEWRLSQLAHAWL
jgi:hypothetical protein